MVKKKLLSIQEVMEILSVSESTVRKLVKDKELAAPKKVGGRSARWFVSDVADYLARLRRQVGDPDFEDVEPESEQRQGAPSRAKPQSI